MLQLGWPYLDHDIFLEVVPVHDLPPSHGLGHSFVWLQVSPKYYMYVISFMVQWKLFTWSVHDTPWSSLTILLSAESDGDVDGEPGGGVSSTSAWGFAGEISVDELTLLLLFWVEAAGLPNPLSSGDWWLTSCLILFAGVTEDTDDVELLRVRFAAGVTRVE